MVRSIIVHQIVLYDGTSVDEDADAGSLVDYGDIIKSVSTVTVEIYTYTYHQLKHHKKLTRDIDISMGNMITK